MIRMLTLTSYEDWKRCITVLFGIPLTSPHIEQKPAALRDPGEQYDAKACRDVG